MIEERNNLAEESDNMGCNAVALLGYYGGDKTHCLSAWQSTSIQDLEDCCYYSEEESTNTAIDRLFVNAMSTKKRSPENLLNFLASNNHHTPFEKSVLHFQVRADIATHIQFLKHRIGVSINTESARYKELQDKWYLPSDWASFDGVTLDLSELPGFNKQGSSGEEDLLRILDWYAEIGHKLYHMACDRLEPIVGRSRAKETSRYFLPYCKQLDFDVMFNFRSFMHFQQLRNNKHAQLEIRTIAEDMLHLVRSIPEDPFELSIKAFLGEN